MNWSTPQPVNTKRNVQDYIRSLGGSSSYSGKTKTLFINDTSGQFDIEHAVLLKFPNLSFSLKTN